MTPEIEKSEMESIPFHRSDWEWKEQLIALVQVEQADELCKLLGEVYPADLAVLFHELEESQGLFLLQQVLDAKTAGEVLREMEDSLRADYLNLLSISDLARILLSQESDEATDLLGDLKDERISQVLARLPVEDRVQITELLSYPDNTAGAIMAKEFVVVRINETVKKAIQTIRQQSREADDFYVVYVEDEHGHYAGHVNLKRLILASPNTKVKRISEEELLPIPVDMDQEEVANIFTRYNFITAPVVDSNGVIVGRITADDVMEVMQEEASEDILRLGGLSGSETLFTPFIVSAARRILWLTVNLGTAVLSASVVHLFAETIEKAVILAALMPIVAGMGGNAAGQTVAIVVRNIALDQLSGDNQVLAVLREALFGLSNGLVLGSVTALLVGFYSSSWVLALVIALAMLVNMLVAALAGVSFPLLLRRAGVDPAIAASIFVTTATDVMGFFVFLGLARISLPYIAA